MGFSDKWLRIHVSRNKRILLSSQHQTCVSSLGTIIIDCIVLYCLMTISYDTKSQIRQTYTLIERTK